MNKSWLPAKLRPLRNPPVRVRLADGRTIAYDSRKPLYDQLPARVVTKPPRRK